MKKRTKLIAAVIIVVVIGIVVTGLFYINVPDFLARGTIAKAEKYRKQTMTERDIQLRSEFVKDTVQLRKTIKGLACFQQLNEKIVVKIQSGMNSISNHPLLMDPVYSNPMITLREYGNFLVNHDSDLVATMKMLEVFYSEAGNADQSLDVEKNLRDFGGFMQQIIDQDSVFINAALDIDRYIDKESKKKHRSEDFAPLVSFRNDLLVSNVMMASILGQKTTIGKLTEYAKSVNADAQIFSAVNELNFVFRSNYVSSAELGSFLCVMHDLNFVDVVE